MLHFKVLSFELFKVKGLRTERIFFLDFTAGDGSTLIRAMDEAMGQQVTPKAAAPAPNTAGTAATPGSAGGQHLNKTPQSAPTVPVDEDETQDPSAGMEGQFRVILVT